MGGLILELDAAPWAARVQNVIDTSRKTGAEIVAKETGAVVSLVVGITPPASGGVTGGPALTQGRKKIKKDVSSLYGTPSQAAALIKNVRGTQMTRAFWKHFKAGDDQAKVILKDVAGVSLSPFDGGTMHKRAKRYRARQPYFYINDPAALKAYIKEVQTKVGLMAAGWKVAAERLGVRLPAWIAKHEAPGLIGFEFANGLLQVTVTNGIPYASNVGDMARRVQWALNAREDILRRAWEDFLKTLEAAEAAGSHSSL